MKKHLFIAVFMVSVSVSAQPDIWEQWDTSVIRQANTAADFEYYSDEEKKVVFFMNLARIDGPLFAETFLDEYTRVHQIDNNTYLRSLYRDLKKTEGLPVLVPEEDLTSIAQGHAIESGKTGHTGHKNFDRRFDPLMGNPYMEVGENCSYGYANAIDIVVSLLIDDGVKSLGHRENILKPSFNSVGVAIREHKRYRFNCVIDFGKQDRSNLNNAPL
ncbi:MAG: CAP domain-containing protein [Bacteroidales bacterium]|nr:CAP domain-containing protein [Bacteroidales bacterium]MCF8346242.1 CAP domain-containing protein [Bacteroidales bacterium]